MPNAPTPENPRQSVPDLCPSEPALSGAEGVKRPRGGRRPGAGAPKGNLNGFKHGLHSKQLAAIGLAFASHPKLQEALLTFSKRQQNKHRKAERVAADIFAKILTRGIQVTTDKQRRALKDFADYLDRN